MSADAATLRQIARSTFRTDDNAVRLLENILDRLDAAETDIAGFSSYTPFLGVGYMFDDDAITDGSSLAADITHASGAGVATESFTTTGTPAATFTGFSLDAGTYYIAFASDVSNNATDLYIRYHTAFPGTGGAIQTAGSQLAGQASTFGHDYVSGILTLTATRKVWAYIDQGGSDSATMYVHRLA